VHSVELRLMIVLQDGNMVANHACEEVLFVIAAQSVDLLDKVRDFSEVLLQLIVLIVDVCVTN
jgi:hypothetical protein